MASGEYRMIKQVAILCLLCLALGAGPRQGAAQGQAFSFPEVEGWKLAGQPQLFSPETLYEYIDGGADLYLKYEFQALSVAEYRNDAGASVTVEVYRHRQPNHAFGIYSQERVPGADFLEMGAQGYYESQTLNFIQGGTYVKLTSDNTGAGDREVLLAFARRISRGLAGHAALPEILSAFPADGRKKHSEKFIATDFLGYSFLHSGFTADYEIAGEKFQLFVIEGDDPADARRMLETYLGRVGAAQATVAEGPHQVKDPYHGAMALSWKGKHIWGTVNLNDPDLRSRYLKQFGEAPSR